MTDSEMGFIKNDWWGVLGKMANKPFS